MNSRSVRFLLAISAPLPASVVAKEKAALKKIEL
jgi:hypothetical protein